MGRVGTEEPQGAMGGDPEDTGAPERIETRDTTRLPGRDVPMMGAQGVAGVMLDPSDLQPPAPQREEMAPKPGRMPREAPEPVDFSKIEQIHRQRAEQALNESIASRARERFAELAAMPDPRAIPPEKLAEMSPIEYQQVMEAIAARRSAENDLKYNLKSEYEMKSLSMNLAQQQILEYQRNAASRYPDIANELLSRAINRPGHEQMSHDLYDRLAAEIVGERVLRQEAESRMREAAASVTGGNARGGMGPQGQTRSISSQEVQGLKDMGIKGRWLDATIARMEGRR